MIASVYHGEIPAFLAACAQTPPVQRLKDIGMNCGCEYTALPRFCGLPPYSRYNHSIGVALIVWHFTGDPAQATAGLLHDIATPVFAHVIDFLKGDSLRQEATEAGTLECILGAPALQTALQQAGLATEEVCDYRRYPIADNPSPRLSADRLEYTLGDSVDYSLCSLAEAKALYHDLTVMPNEQGTAELAFRSAAAAERFALLALQCGQVYASPEDRYAMQLLAELLKNALHQGVLTEADLHTTEPQVIQKLIAHPRLSAQWADYRALAAVRSAPAPEGDGAWRQIATKRRFIDPLSLECGRVSRFSQPFREAKATFLSQSQKDWLCRG